MSSSPTKPPGGYIVGYGRPPLHTRFRKGVSGNPRGRPRRTAGRAWELMLKELYRPLRVREGDEIRTLPGCQVSLRQMVQLAARATALHSAKSST
jgi:hypothetical protein